MLSLIKFVFNRAFLISLVIALLLLLLGTWVTFKSLNAYTQHGETITVPDITGLTMEQVELYLKHKRLDYFVLDSTFVVGQLPSVVLDQDPEPNAKVKEFRKIYLTVNANKPPKIKMPNLIDKSLRQAAMELESWGLKVGALHYKPDLAKNAVLGQLVNKEQIEPGDMVAKGTSIDLVLGDGLGSTRLEVPFLVGLTLEEAKFVLVASFLNIGAIVYDETVEDSISAIISKQIPEPSSYYRVMLSMGESVDLFLTQEIPDPFGIDSLAIDTTLTLY